jgi:ribosome-associated protein
MTDAKKLAELCALKCLEKKAENVVILDLENRSSVAEYFVVCSGFSDRQVVAIADNVADELKKAGVKSLSQEGMVEGRWALIDFGSVIVHIFQDHLRDFYSLESLWADAPRIRVQEKENNSISPRYKPDFNSGSPAF